MTFNEEYAIKNAVNLIYNLNGIEDENFVEEIINCVIDKNEYALNQMLLADEVRE